METKQHVQLPNNMTKSLEPQDLLIYVGIKRFMNKTTKEAFPSLETLSKITGASVNTVRNSIKKLADNKYIEIIKNGRQHIYKFTDYLNFEPFSYEFLDNQNLTFTEKAYVLASQQYMFKDENTMLGKVSYSNHELSTLLNMSERTITRVNSSLQSKGYLDIIGAKKSGNGIRIKEKFFHLDELGQAIIFTLQRHEEMIEQNTKDIEDLKATVKILIKENRDLKEEIKASKEIIMR